MPQRFLAVWQFVLEGGQPVFPVIPCLLRIGFQYDYKPYHYDGSLYYNYCEHNSRYFLQDI